MDHAILLTHSSGPSVLFQSPMSLPVSVSDIHLRRILWNAMPIIFLLGADTLIQSI